MCNLNLLAWPSGDRGELQRLSECYNKGEYTIKKGDIGGGEG